MIAKFMRRLRRKAGLSLSQLSKEVNIPIDRLKQLEWGLEDGTSEELFAIVNALNTTIAVLIGEDIRRPFGQESCHYCGIQYHPMGVWRKVGSRIHVCGPEVVNAIGKVYQNCKIKAGRDGYTYRPKETPSR